MLRFAEEKKALIAEDAEKTAQRPLRNAKLTHYRSARRGIKNAIPEPETIPLISLIDPYNFGSHRLIQVAGGLGARLAPLAEWSSAGRRAAQEPDADFEHPRAVRTCSGRFCGCVDQHRPSSPTHLYSLPRVIIAAQVAAGPFLWIRSIWETRSYLGLGFGDWNAIQ